MARRLQSLSVACLRMRHALRLRAAIIIIALAIMAIASWNWSNMGLTREAKYWMMVESIRSGKAEPELWRGRQACKLPIMTAFSPKIMKYFRDSEPIYCFGERDWVDVDGSTAFITPGAKREHGPIRCNFTELKRTSDYSVWPGLTTQTTHRYKFTTSDFARVDCVGESGETWSNILAGARPHADTLGWDKVPKKAMNLNVLMFGFDSVSRLNFIRKLPKSYEFLTQNLTAVVLEGYNIVGDGTPQAIIPILTGKMELELPETRKRKLGATYVNAYPFIWNDFHNAGYVTGYMEDTPSFGIFTYRLKGFNDAPTDHYMRPYFLDAQERYYQSFSKYCLGSRPRHKVMMDYIKSLFKTHAGRPKFVFGFHAELSHDDMNKVGAADADLLDWLKWYAKTHWKDTVLILMSDHGNRYGNGRTTQQGKLEERLPFFSFVFPPWFGEKYPEALRNLQTNAHRLTTPFDIHATLAGILDPPPFTLGNRSHRGIPLFQEVPASRTCMDAFIEPHWCACLEWQRVDKNDSLIQEAGKSLVEEINHYNADYTDACAPLGLRHLIWAAKLVPSEAFRKFRKTKDPDGLVPDLTGDTAVTAEVFQLQFVTDPGQAVFEASVTHDPTTGAFSFRIGDVSRLNEYGNQARCVYGKFEHLRKFCYCKD